MDDLVNSSVPHSPASACKRSTSTHDKLISPLPSGVEPPLFSPEALGGGYRPYLEKGKQLGSVFADPMIDSQPPYRATPTFKVLGSQPQPCSGLNGTKSRSKSTGFKFKSAISSSVKRSPRVLIFAHPLGEGVDRTPRPTFTDHKLKSKLPPSIEPSFKVLGIRDPRANINHSSKTQGLESVFSFSPTMNLPIS